MDPISSFSQLRKGRLERETEAQISKESVRLAGVFQGRLGLKLLLTFIHSKYSFKYGSLKEIGSRMWSPGLGAKEGRGVSV